LFVRKIIYIGADEIIVKPLSKEAIEAVLNGLVEWGSDNNV